MKTFVIAGCVLLFAACTPASPGNSAVSSEQPPQALPPRPQQAGQPIDLVEMAGRMLAMRGAAITGDQHAVQAQMEAMHEQFRRSAKLADPSRPIDREAARGVVQDMAGVRTVHWVDRSNLLVRVSGQQHRNSAMIDAACVAMEPLGDTLAVVVHLQDADARDADGLQTISRNCQLQPGDRAMFQSDRSLDVVPESIRLQQKSRNANAHEAAARQRAADRENAAILNGMAEM